MIRLPIRGVIFDLDGTLIDSYDAIARSLNHALQVLGKAPIPADRVRRMVGHGLERLVEEAIGPEQVAEGVRLFRVHYEQVAIAGTRSLPGVVPTLAALKQRGYRMAVASNKPARFGQVLLDHLGMMSYLLEVLGPDRVGNPKPHPEMVRRLLGVLRLRPDQVIYVGDMPVDVETCRNAGLTCWLIPTGSSSAEELADVGGDRLLRQFSDLLRLLPPLPPAPLDVR